MLKGIRKEIGTTATLLSKCQISNVLYICSLSSIQTCKKQHSENKNISQSIEFSKCVLFNKTGIREELAVLEVLIGNDSKTESRNKWIVLTAARATLWSPTGIGIGTSTV